MAAAMLSHRLGIHKPGLIPGHLHDALGIPLDFSVTQVRTATDHHSNRLFIGRTRTATLTAPISDILAWSAQHDGGYLTRYFSNGCIEFQPCFQHNISSVISYHSC